MDLKQARPGPYMDLRTTRSSLGAQSTAGASSSGNSVDVRTELPPGKRRQPSDLTDDVLRVERESLVTEKKKELRAVSARHDDLVREIYHMRHFTGMLTYHPVIARNDLTNALDAYKREHFTLIDTTEAGPCHRTRNALKGKKAEVPSATSVLPDHLRLEAETSNEELYNIIVEEQAKRKADAGDRLTTKKKVHTSSKASASPSTSNRLGMGPSSHVFETSSAFPLKEPVIIRVRNIPAKSPVGPSAGTSVTVQPMVGSYTTLAHLAGFDSDLSSLTDMESGEEAEKPTKSHADTKAGRIDDTVPNSTLEVVSAVTSTLDGKGKKRKKRKKRMEEETDKATIKPTPAVQVKRLKLIVRKPAPTYTNPQQKPPPPLYNGSLRTMFSAPPTAWHVPGMQEAGTEESYYMSIKSEAAIRNLELDFRNEGRFLPNTDILFGTRFDPEEPLPKQYQGPTRETTTVWDAVVQAIVANRQGKTSNFGKGTYGQQMASQVASCIKAYWEGQRASKKKVKERQGGEVTARDEKARERARIQEEKQLRALAKSTIKQVVAEWKKAVYHVRNQKRFKEEEEERKRGQEHLNAILSQSGQLLSYQQQDLRRSANVHWADSDDDNDMSDTFTDDESDMEKDNPSSGGVHTDRDLGTSLLLMDPGRQQAGIGTRDPFSQMEWENDSEAALDELLLPEPESSPPRQPAQPCATHRLSTPRASPSSPQHKATNLVGQANSFTNTRQSSPSTSLHETPIVRYVPPKFVTPSPAEDAATTKDAAQDSQSSESGIEEEDPIPVHLRPYAVAPVPWDPSKPITPPALLRGTLRPYQQAGLEWLASLHARHLNGILADEMGLGKTIQTIALLAHLACDRGIWGPHLIVVPTSVLLNWEMEFKKFLPGFKVLSYHGTPQRRKELRKGWRDKYAFNVCITSYTLAAKDQLLFKRRNWYYMILDEAHMIKNFRSQRWNVLLMFRSFRRLLLTGTPLQNNLTELWALLQFLMSGLDFVNLKEFGDWFSSPLEKAIELGGADDSETLQRVSKLHTVLRPYILRRLKRDVEKELPSKFEHLLLCPLSRRQRFLYDEYMSRVQIQCYLRSGVYQKIANILMQLRKVCNHPDLFEVRPIVTPFAMPKSAIADFEIKELFVRKRWCDSVKDSPDIAALGLRFVRPQPTSTYAIRRRRALDASSKLPFFGQRPTERPPKDTRTVAGFKLYAKWLEVTKSIECWSRIHYVNKRRCHEPNPPFSAELLDVARSCYEPLLPASSLDGRPAFRGTPPSINAAILSYKDRESQMAPYLDRFAFVTPAVIARDLPRFAITENRQAVLDLPQSFDEVLHRASVKLQIAFPDASLLQFDCGKLQLLAELLREKKAGGHRVLIFTQMTRVLDILETFLNFHGYLYLRLDGATKIEDRQYITERFNADPRVFCVIASSRSGGVGINLTGADTVIFYDSDFNPQMDRQCEDRAHRIGQIRDVHIYRLVSQHTVEEAMLRRANQKRTLDNLVIQKGSFDWATLLDGDQSALTRALGECDEAEDAQAATLAAQEACALEGADEADFEDFGMGHVRGETSGQDVIERVPDGGEKEEGGTTIDYMVTLVERDWEFFGEWRV